VALWGIGRDTGTVPHKHRLVAVCPSDAALVSWVLVGVGDARHAPRRALGNGHLGQARGPLVSGAMVALVYRARELREDETDSLPAPWNRCQRVLLALSVVMAVTQAAFLIWGVGA